MLWLHRDLLWQFTLRAVEMKHRGSHLGIVWAVLSPLMMLGLYVFTFGYVFGGSFGVIENETKLDYALAVFLGLTVLHLFTEVLGNAPGLVCGQANFVKKVVFPLEILPASAVLSSLSHAAISTLLVLAGVVYSGGFSVSAVLSLVLIFTPVVMMCIGAACVLSAIGVFFRDLSQVTGFVSMVALLSSAIFYPVHKIPPEVYSVLRFNPILQAVNLSREVVLWHQPMDWTALGYLWLVGALFYLVGSFVFARLKPAFADVL